MINIKQLKTIKGLSATSLPKIKRIIVCPDRKDYMSGVLTFNSAIYKGFSYNHNVVYVLWIGSNIVYVGKSNFVIRRLQSHKSRIKYTHVSLLNFKDKKTMEDVEVRLIQKHRPVFNKRHNPDHGYVVIT